MNAAPSALHEVRVLLRLGEDSPHTVQLRDYFEENISGTLHFYLELEHCAGGDLEMLIKSRQRRVTEPGSAAANVERRPFSEAELVDILSQVYAGVRWVHARRVIHCDIKPANVLLTANGRVKICDFGIGKLLKHTGASTHHMAGSRAFMAPEVLRYFMGDKVRFTSSADIWSLGVVAVAMMLLVGTPRMRRLTDGGELAATSRRELLASVLRAVPSRFDTAEGSGDSWASELVRRSLVLDPEPRASAEELVLLFPPDMLAKGIVQRGPSWSGRVLPSSVAVATAVESEVEVCGEAGAAAAGSPDVPVAAAVPDDDLQQQRGREARAAARQADAKLRARCPAACVLYHMSESDDGSDEDGDGEEEMGGGAGRLSDGDLWAAAKEREADGGGGAPPGEDVAASTAGHKGYSRTNSSLLV